MTNSLSTPLLIPSPLSSVFDQNFFFFYFFLASSQFGGFCLIQTQCETHISDVCSWLPLTLLLSLPFTSICLFFPPNNDLDIKVTPYFLVSSIHSFIAPAYCQRSPYVFALTATNFLFIQKLTSLTLFLYSPFSIFCKTALSLTKKKDLTI